MLSMRKYTSLMTIILTCPHCLIRYKKIHAIVIRGGFFCPSCLDSVADYLNIRKNNMIMGKITSIS